MSGRCLIAALLLLSCTPFPRAATSAPGAASDFCPEVPEDFTYIGAPSSDLYCIELVPPPSLDGAATGVVQLAAPASPFGTSVTRDGHHRYQTTFFIRGLPEPASLGAAVFVAWAAPTGFVPLTKLGTVRNGRVDGGVVALNKFYVLVSAEASDTVTERHGPLVLRGLSASTRMRDPHFMPAGGDTAHQHHAADGWQMPPHDPRVSMMPMGIEQLIPAVTPFLPGGDADHATIPFARPRELLRPRDGDTITLTAALVRRRIKGRDVVMYGFNGQYPGPLVDIAQKSTIHVRFNNRTEHETAVHWHGVRLDNRFDGVPHLTQEPVPPGGSFLYTVHFPDPGIYWYHPHHREDIQQDLGLYGNLMVRSADPDYFGAANREEVLMLDDLLLAGNGPVPWGREAANFAVMGRFGNVLLVNGEPVYSLDVNAGDVVRFHFTNASNTRTFNLSFENARMKVVASDVSRFEREEWVESVVLAPAERYVVDVRFERSGPSALTNRLQAIDHMMGLFVAMVDTLGVVNVSERTASPDHGRAFTTLRTHDDVMSDVARYRHHFARGADHELELRMDGDSLPFELTQVMKLDSLYFNPVEWAGTMPMMDWLPTTREMRWVLRDARTGAENDDIAWRFRVGDVVRIRVRNERHGLHAMQHPIHFHGQRFLVLSANGVPTTNHVWKDTVLIPVGTSVELLLELSNPGKWMVHCHIAEHLEAGMKMVFEVR